jgi:hypothetical protein
MVDSNASPQVSSTDLPAEVFFEKQFGQLANLFRVLRQAGLTFDDCQVPITDATYRNELVRYWKNRSSAVRVYRRVREQVIAPTLSYWDPLNTCLEINDKWLGIVDKILCAEGISTGEVIDQLCSGDSPYTTAREQHPPTWSVGKYLIREISSVPTRQCDSGDIRFWASIIRRDFLLAVAEVLL